MLSVLVPSSCLNHPHMLTFCHPRFTWVSVSRGRIIDCLKEQQYIKAIGLLAAALEAFPASALFGPTEKMVDNSGEELCKSAEYSYRFKVIFIGKC